LRKATKFHEYLEALKPLASDTAKESDQTHLLSDIAANKSKR